MRTSRRHRAVDSKTPCTLVRCKHTTISISNGEFRDIELLLINCNSNVVLVHYQSVKTDQQWNYFTLVTFGNADSRTLRSGKGLTNYHQDLRHSDRNSGIGSNGELFIYLH